MIVIPASALQRVALLSLAQKKTDLWSSPDHGRMVVRRRDANLRPVYSFDLYALADSIGAGAASSGYRLVSESDPLWTTLLAARYEDSGADNVYQGVPTIHPVTVFSQPTASQWATRGSLRFHPLLPLSQDSIDASKANDAIANAPTPTYDNSTLASDHAMAEQLIYQATLFPFQPFLLGHSLTATYTYGPVFFTSIQFSASGQGSLGIVDVSAEFMGGRAVRSPQLAVSTNMAVQPPSVVSGGSSSRDMIFRAATFGDCQWASGVYSTLDDLREEALGRDLAEITPETRLVGITLSITQNVELSFPAPTGSRRQEHGPRFAGLSGREVTGQFTFFSREDQLSFQTGQELTLYFGGPFLFPMPFVDWQAPTTTLDAESGGWVHVQKFRARASGGDTLTRPVTDGTSDVPLSEFALTDLPTSES